MKNIIDYVLGKTFYAKQLSKMEHSLTFYAFFNLDSQADRESEALDYLKLDNILEEKPLKQKTQKI